MTSKTIFTSDHSVSEVLASVASGDSSLDDCRDWLHLTALPVRVLSAAELQALLQSPLAAEVFTADGILAAQNAKLQQRTEALQQAKTVAEAAVKASSKCVLDSLDEWESLPETMEPSGDDGQLRLFDEDGKPFRVKLERREAKYSDKALNYGANAQKVFAAVVDASGKPGKLHPVWVQYVIYWTGSKSTPGMAALPKAPKREAK